MNVEQTMEMLDGQEAEKLLEALYGRAQVQEQKERYREVLKGYRDKFGDGEVKLFTSPGRTEISGNHTDHNHGKVLAGSINLWARQRPTIPQRCGLSASPSDRSLLWI